MNFQENDQTNASRNTKRTETLPTCIAQDHMQTVQREGPADEPAALAPKSELNAIGTRTRRWDGQAKVTGAAHYTADIRLPGMLYARMVNARVPHAKVISIDRRAAERYPGVKA